MNRAVRTAVRPPPMKLWPRHWPDWRVNGRQAGQSARSACGRAVPSSGSSASRVRAMIGPTPGTEASRSSFSRQTGEPRTVSSISSSMLGELASRAQPTSRAMLLRTRGTIRCAAGAASRPPIISMICRRRADQLGQQPGRLRPASGRDLGPGGLGEEGNHRGIDRVGLGPLPDRPGEGAHLRRVDHHHRQARTRQAAATIRLEAAGRLHRHQLRFKPASRSTSSSRPCRITRDCKASPLGTHMHVQPILRYIDPDNGDRPS